MSRGRARGPIAVTSVLVGFSCGMTACSSPSSEPSVTGGYTVRVLSGNEAKQEQQKLASANKANFPDGSYVVIDFSWSGRWSGSCEVYTAVAHVGDGWRLSEFASGSAIGAGADQSVTSAFAKFPREFSGIPQPPVSVGNAPNEDTFTVTAKDGSATIVYAVDPHVSRTISPELDVAAEIGCGGEAKAAARLADASRTVTTSP